jgi:hypothetical protein
MFWLSREQVRANLAAEMTSRFPARHGNFPDKLKIASLGFPNDESRREWGKQLNRGSWFTGWFTPSEFLGCVTVGPVNPPQPNLVDLLFNTQVRPPEHHIADAKVMALTHSGAKS